MRQGGGQQGTLNSDGREVGRVFLSYRERLSREPLAGPGSETWLWRHLGPRGCQLGAAAWAPSPPKHTCSCWRVISGLSKLNASCSTVFFFFFGGGVGMGIHTLINPLRSSLGGGEKGQNWFLRAVGWAEPGACPMAPDGSDVCSCLGSPV